MSKQGLLMVFSVLLIQSACSSQNDDRNSTRRPIEADQNCKYDVIQAHRGIKSNVDGYNQTHDRSYLVGALSACNHFKTIMGNSSCVARYSGSEITLSVEQVAASCDQVNLALNPKPDVVDSEPAPVPSPDPGTEPSVDTLKISELPKGLQMVVKNEIIFNQMLSIGVGAPLENGEIVSAPTGLQPFCVLARLDLTLELRTFDVIDFAKFEINGRELRSRNRDDKIELNCTKLENTEWTVGQLMQVFGSQSEISVVP